jgi:uncharacterized protein YdaU (DUF1376 family)
MNYYKRHIGDYAAATRHLSLLEHGVYCLLMDVYYSSECALPVDLKRVQRLIAARSRPERAAVEMVLNEFFEEHGDGWHQSRCDEEIHYKQAKAETNQALGKLGGRPKLITDSVIPDYATRSSQRSERVPRTETESNPSQKPVANSHYSPSTPDGVPAANRLALPDCPHVVLIDLFVQQLPQLPQPKLEMWDGKHADAMRARWRWVLTAKKRTGQRYATNREEAIDFFARFFAYVAGSDFLMGRRGDFTCTLQWLVKAENFSKVVQGNYENKAAA